MRCYFGRFDSYCSLGLGDDSLRYFLAFLFAFNVAVAQDFSSLVGTHEVGFESPSEAGVYSVCALKYKALAISDGYRKGRPVVVVGNLAYVLSVKEGNVDLRFQVGVANVGKSLIFTPPHSAYIKTKNGRSSEADYLVSRVVDGGRREYIFNVNKDSSRILRDIISERSFSVVFNDMDEGGYIEVPIDLEVVGVQFDGGVVRRERSEEMYNDFISCVSDITDSVLDMRKSDAR